MVQFKSNSFARKGFSEQPHSYAFARHYPTKRVNRLFYNPEQVVGIDRVFSEYDWRTHTFCPTLGGHSPPQRSLHQSSPSDATTISEDTYGRVSTSKFPKSSPGEIPNEALVSSYLLSTFQSASSSSGTSDDAWKSSVYSSSPLSYAESSHSPLQQSSLAYAEVDQAPRLKIRRGPHPKKTCDSEAAEQEILPMQIDRSLTWASPAFDATEENSKSVEGDVNTLTHAAPLSTVPHQAHLTWDHKPRRRISAPQGGRPHRPTYLRTRTRGLESRIDQNLVAKGVAIEPEDDDETPNEYSRNSRLAVLVSALHYQYVSASIRIQLAVHRTEKKLARRLRKKRIATEL